AVRWRCHGVGRERRRHPTGQTSSTKRGCGTETVLAGDGDRTGSLATLGYGQRRGKALMVKFGVEAVLTVRARVVVANRLPEVPVMVTVAVPVVAELLAVSVSVLVPPVLDGLNDAVTPLGRPDAARLTLPLNPFWSFTVMVLVPPAPPWVMVRLLGESESVKLGNADPASALIRFWPFGLPHPVTKS